MDIVDAFIRSADEEVFLDMVVDEETATMDLNRAKDVDKDVKERIVLKLSFNQSYRYAKHEVTENDEEMAEIANNSIMLGPTKLRINLGRIREHLVEDESVDEQELVSDGEEQSLTLVTDEEDELFVSPSDTIEKENFVSDFDLMRKRKQKERAYGRHKKVYKGIDLINDEEGKIQQLVEAMQFAVRDDHHSNTLKLPAFKKLKLLPKVKEMLQKIDLIDAMIDNGMMAALSEWLAPLPDQSLPSFEIRYTLLKQLQTYKLDQGTLRQSGLGKAVMLLLKHPKESKTNKALAHKLVEEWARPIFGLSTDFGTLTREERRQLDYKHDYMQNGQRGPKRHASEQPKSSPKRPPIEVDSKYLRARVPKVSHTTYTIRPPSGLDLVEDEENEDEPRSAARYMNPLRELLLKKSNNRTRGAKKVNLIATFK